MLTNHEILRKALRWNSCTTKKENKNNESESERRGIGESEKNLTARISKEREI